MPINELYKNKATLIQKARAHRQDAWQQETLGDYHRPGSPERKKAAHKANRSLKASNIAGKMAGHKFGPDEETIIESGGLSPEAHELVLHADNNRHLHNSSHTPIMNNLKKKMKKGTYNSEKAKKLWGYHADRAAHSYTKEHGHPGQKWHQAFSTKHRKEAAAHWEAHHRDELSEEIAINELSRKLLGRYVQKAAFRMAGKGYHIGKEMAKPPGEFNQTEYNKLNKKLSKHERGITRAASRLAKEETLDELSKKTLKKYIHKSAEDLEDSAGTETYAATKGRFDVADAMSKKASNRKLGIKRAANRMAEEENVDEYMTYRAPKGKPKVSASWIASGGHVTSPDVVAKFKRERSEKKQFASASREISQLQKRGK